jgi:hypothetical protein
MVGEFLKTGGWREPDKSKLSPVPYNPMYFSCCFIRLSLQVIVLPTISSMNNEISLIFTLIRRRCRRHFSLPPHPHQIPPLHQ